MLSRARIIFSAPMVVLFGVKAVNGCRFNPVIRKKDRFEFADGSPATLQIIRQKCFTKMGGAGKNRLLLDGVIERVLDYFEEHRS